MILSDLRDLLDFPALAFKDVFFSFQSPWRKSLRNHKYPKLGDKIDTQDAIICGVLVYKQTLQNFGCCERYLLNRP